jgi:hypothetical protein
MPNMVNPSCRRYRYTYTNTTTWTGLIPNAQLPSLWHGHKMHLGKTGMANLYLGQQKIRYSIHIYNIVLEIKAKDIIASEYKFNTSH